MKSKSPYIPARKILTIALSILAGTGVVMFALTGVAMLLTILFIVLKVAAVSTLGWLWTFSPLWVLISIPISVGVGSIIIGYMVNAYIFLKRVAGKFAGCSCK